MNIEELFRKAQEEGLTEDEQKILLSAIAGQLQKLEKEDHQKYLETLKELTAIAKELNQELRDLEQIA